MKRLTLTAAAAVLALTGCSSSTPAPRTDITTFAPTLPSLETVATQAGCTEYTPSAEVGTTAGATCTVGGHELYVYTFGDDSARDSWLKVAKSAGALGTFQSGTSWVIQTL